MSRKSNKLSRRIRSRVSGNKQSRRIISRMPGNKLSRRIRSRVSGNKLSRRIRSRVSGNKLSRSRVSGNKLSRRRKSSSYRMTGKKPETIVADYDISPTSKVQIKAFEGDKHIPKDIKAVINAFMKKNKKVDVEKELDLIRRGNVGSLEKGVRENKFLLNPNRKHIQALLDYKYVINLDILRHDDYIDEYQRYEDTKTFETMCKIVVNNTAREDDLKDMIAMVNGNDRYLLGLLNKRLELVKDNIRSIQVNPRIRQRDEEDATFLSLYMPNRSSKRKRNYEF